VYHAIILSLLVVVCPTLALLFWHDCLCVQVKNGNRKYCKGNTNLFCCMVNGVVFFMCAACVVCCVVHEVTVG
jgi:hypothetical protein